MSRQKAEKEEGVDGMVGPGDVDYDEQGFVIERDMSEELNQIIDQCVTSKFDVNVLTYEGVIAQAGFLEEENK